MYLIKDSTRLNRRGGVNMINFSNRQLLSMLQRLSARDACQTVHDVTAKGLLRSQTCIRIIFCHI